VRRLGSTLLGVFVSLCIFFAAGELLSRVYHLPERVNGFPRQLYVATDDAEVPYVLRPGLVTTVRSIPVRVNALGLRGREVPLVPEAGVHRVLALGDSTTFGEGLAEEDAFPVQLERELNARGGERWEVLNAGVQGYNTEGELGFLRTRGLAMRPETIVVGFNLNDFDYCPVIGPLGVLTRDRGVRVSRWSPANLSEFYLVIRWLLLTRGRFLGAKLGGEAALTPKPEQRFGDFDRAVSTIRKRYYANPTDDRWQVMVSSLHGLGEVARTNGLPLIIAIIPDGDQLETPDPSLQPQEKVLAICADAELDCLDLYPAFVAAGGTGLHLDIMHPNAAGQRVVAHALADRLRSATERRAQPAPQ
jgi:lysophospholipase L1-like esterase